MREREKEKGARSGRRKKSILVKNHFLPSNSDQEQFFCRYLKMRAGLSVRPRAGLACSCSIQKSAAPAAATRPVAAAAAASSSSMSISTKSRSTATTSSPFLSCSPSLPRPRSVRASATSGTPGHLRPKELLDVALKAAEAGADVSFACFLLLLFFFSNRQKREREEITNSRLRRSSSDLSLNPLGPPPPLLPPFALPLFRSSAPPSTSPAPSPSRAPRTSSPRPTPPPRRRSCR